ncbi:hypothetical protein ACS0TY_004266 [Phlomoides rotata]
MSHTRKLGQKRRGSRESSSALQDQQVYGGSFHFGAEIGVGSGGAYSESSTVQYFLHVFGAAKELLRGKFDEYPDVHEMYCTARLADMLDDYSK